MPTSQQIIGNQPPEEPKPGQDILPWMLRFYRWCIASRAIAGAGLSSQQTAAGTRISLTETNTTFWGKLTWDNTAKNWDFVELFPADAPVVDWETIPTSAGGRVGEAIEVNGLQNPVGNFVVYAQIKEYLVRNDADDGNILLYVFHHPSFRPFIATVTNAGSVWNWTRQRQIETGTFFENDTATPTTGTAKEINGIAPTGGSYSFKAYIYPAAVSDIDGNTVILYNFAMPIPECDDDMAFDFLRVSEHGVPEWGCVRVE